MSLLVPYISPLVVPLSVPAQELFIVNSYVLSYDVN